MSFHRLFVLALLALVASPASAAGLLIPTDGSVSSLEELLCVNGARGTITDPGYSDAGHTYGCDFTADEKRSLISYLLAH